MEAIRSVFHLNHKIERCHMKRLFSIFCCHFLPTRTIFGHFLLCLYLNWTNIYNHC